VTIAEEPPTRAQWGRVLTSAKRNYQHAASRWYNSEPTYSTREYEMLFLVITDQYPIDRDKRDEVKKKRMCQPAVGVHAGCGRIEKSKQGKEGSSERRGEELVRTREGMRRSSFRDRALSNHAHAPCSASRRALRPTRPRRGTPRPGPLRISHRDSRRRSGRRLR
jgi:hypothetical protein